MPKKGENRDGDAKYERIMGLLEQLKAHIEATDRKVVALEKAEDRATARKAAALERAEKLAMEAAEATKLHNEAEGAETGRAGARKGRERSNNQRSGRPEQTSAKSSKTGPGPEVAGEWYDSKTGERGQWPKLVDTRQRLRALRGGGTREREWKTYEFPRGTVRGQFQLWIDGNYAKDVTDEMIKAKGDPMALYGRDDMDGWEALDD
jgi:hypothetical protein